MSQASHLNRAERPRAKVLVVVDDTAECDRALVFAGRMAERMGANIILLALPGEKTFREWIGIGDLIEDEEAERCREALAAAATRIKASPNVQLECIVRFGARSAQVMRILAEDPDISFLVLAASSSESGPGPLVTSLVGKSAGAFPVPIVIVPETMTDDVISALL